MQSPVNLPKWQPVSIESEQALLGAVMINNDALQFVQDFLEPWHFFEPLHVQIYEIMLKLISMGKVANPLTLRTFVPEGLVVEGMTVSQYMARLAASATTIINARDYGRNIRDLALHRQAVSIGEELMRPVPVDISQLATDSIDALDDIVATYGTEAERAIAMPALMSKAVDAAAQAYQNEGMLLGMSTGLADLDKKLLGLHGGDLVIMAARPGMGKTALLLSLARNLGRAGHPGQIFSLEMGGVSLAQRMISDELFDNNPLEYTILRSGRFHERTFERITEAAKAIALLPLTIEQQSSLTLSQIAAKARRHKRTKGLKWLAVDYLQLVKSSGRYAGNRVLEVGEITAGLKLLAKELDIPVILLSQLNRQLESREDKRPTMSDLRESGNIEQDADVILMLYREGYYVERAMPRDARPDSEEFASWQIKMKRVGNALDIIVEKQRQGPIGSIRVYCNIGCNAVRDLVDNSQLPEAR